MSNGHGVSNDSKGDVTAALVPEPSFREQKKSQLRLEMTRAAVALFKEQGFEATTVEQIAARAQSSERTFFRYFGTKEDVVFGDTPERLRNLRERLDDAGGETPVASVRLALIEQINRFRNFEDPTLEAACAALWLSEERLRRRYIEIVLEWENVISQYLAEQWNVAVDNTDVRLTAMAMIVTCRVALESGRDGLDAAHAAQLTCFRILEHGIRDGTVGPA